MQAGADPVTLPGGQELSPEWITAVLAPLLGPAGARVVTLEASQIGTGQMSRCVRIVPTYEGGGQGPRSLVAKLPASDANSRAAAAALRCYEVEVNFYRLLASTLAVRVPRCYHAAIDLATNDFVLLFEDLAPARPGDQLAGCSPDEAAAAVEELTRLHCPRWGDAALGRFEWLDRNTPEALVSTAQMVAALFPGFVERYEGRLDDEVLALARVLVSKLPSYLGSRGGPQTVVHGDYRLDNLLFGTSPGAGPVVVDWQTAVRGPGMSDLSYFLGAGLLPADRRAVEVDLVRCYYDALRSGGVDGMTWDECWYQYRFHSFGGLVMAIAASMLVQRTERGDDMFMAMAERHGRQALDLDAAALLD